MSPSHRWPHQHTKALIVDYLQAHPTGQFADLTRGVLQLAIARQLLHDPRRPGQMTTISTQHTLTPDDRREFEERTREILWELLVQGLLVFGSDTGNPNWPFYRLTTRGRSAIEARPPQPYDPDSFIASFREAVPDADEVVREYLEEAVQTFNVSCFKAAAVMLGAASERLVLVLFEALLETAPSDPKHVLRRAEGALGINEKFTAMKSYLDSMLESKALPRARFKDTVVRHLPGIYDLIRVQRNAAGHPDAVGRVDPDAIFIDLRLFSEYCRRTHELVSFIKDLFRADPPGSRP